MKKRLAIVALATIACSSVVGVITSSAAPHAKKETCRSGEQHFLVDAGTFGDTDGDRAVCVRDL